MEKMTELTEAQEQRLIEICGEWRQHGLCCEPADFETGDRIIASFYSRLERPVPAILHFSSPLICELAANVVFTILDERPSEIDGQLYAELDRHLDQQFLDQIETQLYSHFGSQVRAWLKRRLRGEPDGLCDEQIRNRLRVWLHSRLRNSGDKRLSKQLDHQPRIGTRILNELEEPTRRRRLQTPTKFDTKLAVHIEIQFRLVDIQLRDEMAIPLQNRLRDQLGVLQPHFVKHRFAAQHWCAWDAFQLFRHEIGVQYDADDLALLLDWSRLSQSIGWWAAWDDICLVSDRPRSVKFDDQRRLHCATGKAVEYSDGWGISSWHGVKIPDEWLSDKNSLTPQIALTQENAERRRAACEILGWDNILSQLDAKIVDADPDPEIGTLLRVDLPDAPQEQFLRVQCGTGRLFAIPVPPDMETAIQAQAWLWNLDMKDFVKPEVRT